MTATTAANRATGTLATLRPALDAVHDIHGWLYYNDENQLVGSVDGEGYLTEYGYDADGHRVRTLRYATVALIAPTAITATTTLAALRPATKATDETSLSVYNALGQLASSTNAEGTITQYTYDVSGNVLTSTVAATTSDARTQTSKYDVQGRVIATLDGVGSAALAALGTTPTPAQVTAVWTTYGTTYSYDADGLQASATDAAGNKTLSFYDADGRATHTVNALGEVQERTYNTLGQIVATTRYGTRIATTGLVGGIDTATLLSAVTTAKNATLDSKVSYTYDAAGHLSGQTDALGDGSTYVNDAFGDRIATSKAAGAPGVLGIFATYDRLGDVKTSWLASSAATTTFTYDAFGRPTAVSDANGNTTSSQYDRLGRTTKTTGPLFVEGSATFDAFGRALTTVDANGKTTSYVYDDVARTARITDPFSAITIQTHNREGQTVTVQDGAGHVTSYAYDADGHLKDTITDPGTGHLALDTHTDYDAAGRIADTVDANGNEVAYTYDAANRVLTRTEGVNAAMGIVTTYTYDAKGQQATVKNPDGIITSFTYDLAGNALTQIVDTAGIQLKTVQTYDVRGNLLTQTDPAGVVTTYTYNIVGRQVSKQIGAMPKATYDYDADGNLTREIDPDGNTTLHVYDAMNRPVYTLDAMGGLTGLTYDNDGHVLTSTQYAKLQPTALTAVVSSYSTAVLCKTSVALVTTDALDQTTTNTYDADGRKTVEEVDKAGLDLKTQYSYDSAGNVTRVIDPAGGVALYIYDAANRVVAALSPAGQLTQTTYDNDGHVAKTTVATDPHAMTTATAMSGSVTNAIVGTVTASVNDIVTQYAYDAANRVKSVTVDPAGLALATLYAYDAAGNRTKVTDPAGNVTLYGYDAAGRQRYMLDPQSFLTETVYDGGGRMTAVVRYGTPITGVSATPTAAGLVSPVFTVIGSSTLDHVTRYGYDGAGRQIYAVDGMGDLTETAYDGAGLVTGTRRYVTAIALPATGTTDGRTLAMTTAQIAAALSPNAADLTTRYGYDADERQVYAVDPAGEVTATVYDTAGRVVQTRAYATAVTQPAFTATFTAAQIKAALAASPTLDLITSYAYDKDGRLQYAVDPTGLVTASLYDGAGRVIETHVYLKTITVPTDGSTLSATSITTSLASLATVQDRISRYAYDADGRQVYAVDAAGTVSATVYDAEGRVRATTVYATLATMPTTLGATMSASDITAALHPNVATDRTTRYVVDDAGRVTYAVDAIGRVTASTYDKDGNLATENQFSQILAVTSGSPLQASNITIVNNAADRLTHYFYDADNRLRFEIDPLGFATETRYFADHITTIRYAAVPVVTYPATTQGVATACASIAVTANDESTTVANDKANRTTDTTDANGVVSRDQYDAFGRVVTHTDALGLPEQTVTGYVYNAVGRVTSKTVAQGTASAQTTLTTYDAFGDVQTTLSPDGYALANLDTPWTQAERLRLFGVSVSAASLTAAQTTELLARYTTKFTVDLDGRTLTTTTAFGSTTATSTSTTTTYDAFGDAVMVVDPMGNAGYFFFDQLGRVSMQVDPALDIVQTIYAGGFDDKIASVRRYSAKAPVGTTQTSTLSPSTSALDAVTSYTYDQLGRVLTTTDAAGSAVAATESVLYRSTDGNVFNKVVTNKVNGATTYVYDRDGQELSETLPVQSKNLTTSVLSTVVNQYTYDAFGNRTSSIEAVGLPEQRTTSYRYDKDGRVLYRIGTAYTAIDGASQATSTTTPVDVTVYDGLGRIVETRSNASWSGSAATGGVRSLTVYDAAGNSTMTVAADGAVVSNLYTTSGKVWTQSAMANRITLPSTGTAPTLPAADALNDRTRYFIYDNLDRLVETRQANVVYWEPKYNGDGSLPTGLSLQAWNTMQRVVYDADGNVLQTVDGRGNSSYTYYDTIGRKVLSIDSSGYATAWDYGDVFDSPTQQIQFSTALAASQFGRQNDTTVAANLRDPAQLRATYAALASATPNRTTQYTYDRAGRTQETRVKSVAYDYVDATGARVSGTADAVTDNVYDGLGNITEQQKSIAVLANGTTAWNVTDFHYDALGRQIEELDPGYADYAGNTVRPTTDTEYDGLGDVRRVVQRGTDGSTETDDRITVSKYDANGNLSSQTDADGNVTTYEYDALGRVSRSTLLNDVDADGNHRNVVKLFQYDAMGRQTVQTDLGTGDIRNTQYDAFGEITAKGLGAGAFQEFTYYNVMGKVERSNSGDGAWALYLYDLNGNTTRKMVSGTVDLSDPTKLSIIDAANGSGLLMTASFYDARNELVQTVEPKIQYLVSSSSESGAYTFGAVSSYGNVGMSAPGTTQPVSSGVGSGAVSTPASTQPATQFNSGSFATPATKTYGATLSPATMSTLAAASYSIGTSRNSGTHVDMGQLTLPSGFPAGSYRLVPGTSTPVNFSQPMGSWVAFNSNVTQSLQFNAGNNHWVTLAQVYDTRTPSGSDGQGNPTFSHVLTGKSMFGVVLSNVPAGVTPKAYMNFGGPGQVAVTVSPILDSNGVAVPNYYNVAVPVGASSLTVEGFDTSGNRVYGQTFGGVSVVNGNATDGTTSNVYTSFTSSTGIAAADSWVNYNGTSAGFSVDGSLAGGTSGIVYIRPVGSQGWGIGSSFSGGNIDTSGVMGGSGTPFEYIVQTAGGEVHGSFHVYGNIIILDNSGQLTQVNELTGQSLTLTIDPTKLALPPVAPSGGYSLNVTVNGYTFSTRSITPDQISNAVATNTTLTATFSQAEVASAFPYTPFVNWSMGYQFNVVANRADAIASPEIVGQGQGTLQLGSDPSAPVGAMNATGAYLPTATIHLSGALAMNGTLTLTPQSGGAIVLPLSGNWRVKQGVAPTDLSFDLSQWYTPGGPPQVFTVTYTEGNTVSTATLSMDGTGNVTPSAVMQTSIQQTITLSLAGCSTIQILQGGNVVATGSGSSYTWDVHTIATTSSQPFTYVGLNASGQAIAKGTGFFYLATGQLLVSTAPTNVPQFLFTPPPGVTGVQVKVNGNVVPLSVSGSGSGMLYVPDPSIVPPLGTAASYTCVYTGSLNSVPITIGTGTLTIDVNGVCGQTFTPNYPPLVIAGPKGYNVPGGQLQLVLSPKPAGVSSNVVTLAGAWDGTQMQFTWPLGGTPWQTSAQTFSAVVTLLDQYGNPVKTSFGNPVVSTGTVTTGASASQAPVFTQTVQTVQGPAIQITKAQTWDAFGEVATESDAVTDANAAAMATYYGGESRDTTAVAKKLTYNALGQLILETDPQTDIVYANGFRARATPQTAYGYDLEGRLTTTTDANGALTRQNYAGDGDRVSTHWNPVNAAAPTAGDGGRTLTQYDIFGSERRTTISVDSVHGDEITDMVVDKMGYLTSATQENISRVQNATAADTETTPVGSSLTDSYTYDAFGQRITHTNAMNSVDKTYYDNLGRITQTVTDAGHATVYNYGFVPKGQSPGITGPGSSSMGGYQLKTTNADGSFTYDNIDYFGQTTWHQDEGGHQYVYSYNGDAQLVSQIGSGQDIEYSYADNGDLLQLTDKSLGTVSRYGYDAAGNRTSESYGTLAANGVDMVSAWETSTIQYDELGRMAFVKDGSVDVRYQYDAVGNRRSVQAIYLDAGMGLRQQDNFWYTYDAANRFLISKGSLAGNATSPTDTGASIQQGTQGLILTYDYRGDRMSAADATTHSTETYTYSMDGFLENANVNGAVYLRRVDALGRTFDMATTISGTTTHQLTTYDRDNRVLLQSDANGSTSFTYFSAFNGTATSQTGAGALASETTTATGGGGTSTTSYTYQYWDAAEQNTITVAAGGGGGSGMTTFKYNVNGFVTEVDASDRTLVYKLSADGLIMSRLQTLSVGNSVDNHYWYYAGGRTIGDVSDSNQPDLNRMSYAEQLALTTKDGVIDTSSYKKAAPVKAADFDQNYQPINSSYPPATPSSYTVHSGDTLRSIARSLWGDADEWYLIAQANNLTGNETLVKGQVLVIPNKVTNIHNNSDTFRPYNPGEAIGNIDPTLPPPPTPAAAHGGGGCGGIGTILMVVVAIVVTIYTAGAAAELLGAALSAGGTTMGLGASVLAGGLGAGVATGVTTGVALAAAAVGGAMGSIASQLVGEATGTTQGFSWKQVAMSAVGSAVTAGVGEGLNAAFPTVAASANASTQGLSASQIFTQSTERFGLGVASAVGSSAIEQGLKGEWSWREIAASAAGASAGQAAGSAMSSAMGNMVGSSVASRLAAGVASGWSESEVLASDPRYTKSRMSTLFISSLGSALGDVASDEVTTEEKQAIQQQGVEQSDAIQARKFAEIDAHNAAGPYDYPSGDFLEKPVMLAANGNVASGVGSRYLMPAGAAAFYSYDYSAYFKQSYAGGQLVDPQNSQWMANDLRYTKWLNLQQQTDSADNRQSFIDNLQKAGVNLANPQAALQPVGVGDTQDSLRKQIVYQMGPAFEKAYNGNQDWRTYVDVATSGRQPGDFVNIQDIYAAVVGSAVSRAADASGTIYSDFVHNPPAAPQNWIDTVKNVASGVAAQMSLSDILRNDDQAPPSLRYTSSVDHLLDVLNVGMTAVDGVGLALKAPSAIRAGIDAASALVRIGAEATRNTIAGLQRDLPTILGNVAASMFKTDGTSRLGSLSDAVALQLSKFIPNTQAGGVGELLGKNMDLRNGETIIDTSTKQLPINGGASLTKLGSTRGLDWVSFDGAGENVQLHINESKMYWSDNTLDTATSLNVNAARDNFGRSMDQLRDTVTDPAFADQHGLETQRALLDRIENNEFDVRYYTPKSTRIGADLTQDTLNATHAREVKYVQF